VRIGLAMARKYDAHLTGVLVHGLPHALVSATPYIPDSLSEQFADIAKRMKSEVYDRITRRFAELTTTTPPKGKVHWLDVEGAADATIIEMTRCFDITLMGQYEAVAGEEQIMLHPDLVALKSGKPVLVVPGDYQVEVLNEHAVLAWDGTRAASRAMADAMQILETKSLVTILTIGADTLGRGVGGADIAVQLERHGIKSEWVRLPKRGAVGSAIVHYCRERNAGILVMGAYEHSKFGEDLVGGVTNDVLSRSAIPVLMSH